MNAPSAKQLTKEQYHARVHELSASMIKQFRRDVVEFHDTYEVDIEDRRPPFVETKPMETGSIIHAVVLDGSPLRSVVGVYPEHDPRLSGLKTMSGKTRDDLPTETVQFLAPLCGVSVNEFMAAKGGKELKAILSRAPEQVIGSTGVISSKAAAKYRESKKEYKYFVKKLGDTNNGKTASYETLQQAIAAIRSSEYYEILESEQVVREQPLFWRDDLTGMLCRCCPDFMLISGKTAFVWDLKITAFATEFEKQMNNLDYHIQDEHYSEGVRANFPEVENIVYTFLAAMPLYPFHVAEWKFRGSDRDTIQGDYRQTMAEIKRRREENDWSHPKTTGTNEAQLWKRTIA